ncbi:LysR family transcriptional regulator [Pseudooctadecabacter jejudonensis]|uniref:Transcriptional activator protein NhaR n=1 Tax=Pseudooctadecabacter jejudonensis TaxID=1391910 RepID=A0A1Y5SEP3_9RHOB|nr:LysR family transcriptional regulator [Pseudooctadecabacter jejudonensis]SLN35963.1 Transcriptional activator protein NhaR [Pseudooctadecabacter jejudonensis]
MDLNYHHLRYFHAVAHEGNLTRAAEKLNVSQSALSMQIKQLEDRLGHAFFERIGRRLELTEAGRIALDHADRIFATGQDLLAVLQKEGSVPTLRIGALPTLSRNFQLSFLRPALHRDDFEIILRSGTEAALLADLMTLNLDVMLSNSLPSTAIGPDILTHRLAEQPVQIHGRPDQMRHATLPDLLRAEPLILPTDPAIKAGILAQADRHNITPRIAAEVDDMAMIRLLAREGEGLAVVPPIVVRDEVAAGRLTTAPFDLALHETFYAITRRRTFPHPLLAKLLSHP